MARPSVFVTRRWPAAVEAKLSANYETEFNTGDKQMTPVELRDVLKRYDAVLPTVTDAFHGEVFNSSAVRTKILANYGVGYSHICEQSARNSGITVTNTPDVLSECTADLAMTLLLMAARRAGEGEREVRAGYWSGWRPTHLVGTKVSGKVLGIVGYGRIGQEMARRACHGFGMKIVIQNRSPVAPHLLEQCNAVQVDTIEELLSQSDFISLHCPGGAANRHLVNSHCFELMKASAFLINTARGEVVDEDALIKALNTGMISGAALDVFENEPAIRHDLFQADNLVMLPHLGSATRETREAMGFRVLDNLDDFFNGRSPRDQVI